MSSQDTFKAASEIQRFVRMFGGLGEISEKLLDISAMQQAAEEAEARIAKAASAESRLKAAQAQAEQLVSGAKEEADQILSGARKASSDMLDRARTDAAEVREKAQTFLAEHQGKARDAQDAAAAALSATKAEETKVREALTEHSRITKLIADLKAKL